MDTNKLALLAFLVPLYGLPCLTIVIDRARRKTKAVKAEPKWVELLALGVFINVAVLAYYFDRTRGTLLARWGGFALSVVFIMISFSMMMGVILAFGLGQ